MSLIPSELRSPVIGTRGTDTSRGISLRSMLQTWSGAITIGVAANTSSVSRISAGAFEMAVPAYTPAAIAVTRISVRSGRIYGVLATGMGTTVLPPPVQPILVTAGSAGEVYSGGGSSYRLNVVAWYAVASFSSAFATLSYPATNVATVTLEVKGSFGTRAFSSSPVSSRQIIFGFEDGTVKQFSGGAMVQATPIPAGATEFRFTVSGGNQTPVILAEVAGNDWRDAVAKLEWAQTGLPWWGQIESAARTGLWVRRSAWTDTTRKIRFDTGLGTSRAVAVMQTGERVTTSDFSAGEFLANDWVILDALEPSATDVTDLVFFAARGSTPFVVLGPANTTTETTNSSGTSTDPATPPPATTLPAAGKGFVYLRDGVATLVPARDITGADWEP